MSEGFTSAGDGGAQSLAVLANAVSDFAARRDWEQFHSPRNLVLALVGEVGELASEFQWLTEDESANLAASPTRAAAVRSELADVLTYLVRLGDVLGVDLLDAAFEKLAENERRYPADQSRGSSAKYTSYGTKDGHG